MKRLTLRFDRGPLAGSQRRFAPNRRRIVLGTADGCDVCFDASTSGIGAEHCELLRDAGRYEIRVNRDDPVWVDGVRVQDGHELTDGSQVALGTGSSVRFTVHYERRSLLDSERVRRSLRVGAWTLGIAVSLLGALGLWGRVEQRNRSAQLAAVNGAVERLRRESAPFSWSPLIARTQPSVYLVIQQSPDGGETAIGTAWVVGPAQLATNAHVAEALAVIARNNPERKLLARSGQEPFEQIALIGARVHPAFEAFRDTWRRYSPMRIDEEGAPHKIDLAYGYDIALLKVAPGAKLAPPLPLASDSTLQELRAGDPVAFVGFPTEQLLETDLTRPNARSQAGSIVSMTSFTLTHAAPGEAQRIEHSLPATGGASGSPIINSSGEVVAVLSGGNVIVGRDGSRTPNAALVNFAQRIDVLRPLLADPSQAGPFDLETLRSTWLADLARYDSPEQATQANIARLVKHWGAKHRDEGSPREISRRVFVDDWDRTQAVAQLRTEMELDAGRHMVIAIGSYQRTLRGAIRSPGGAAGGGTEFASDASSDHYPMMAVQVPSAQRVEIVISDDSEQDVLATTSPRLELRVLRLAR